MNSLTLINTTNSKMSFCICELKAVVWKEYIMKIFTLKKIVFLFLLELKNETKLNHFAFNNIFTYCTRIYF